ncbi:hypothetical protein ILYODFUR_008249 [Ilyodon furcidens]|uniref:Uncharacterized protein n=1 Tax=Ilyodon furcidens TaxID=33524 RepID=A0ABV0SYA8_9TELE
MHPSAIKKKRQSSFHRLHHETQGNLLSLLCTLGSACKRTENAEARNCSLPLRSLFPKEPNNGRSCSLMRRDIVEQFPGDICGESPGMSSHLPPLPYTLLLLIQQDQPLLWLGPCDRSWKKGLLLSPCRRDGRFFSSLFSASLDSHSQKKREKEREKNMEERNKGKKQHCVLWCSP